MAYTESNKKATAKYIKENQQRLYVNYKKDEFNDIIKPAIDKSGLAVATYIKQAVREKIERDSKL